MKYQYLPGMVKAMHISNIVFIRHKRDADITSKLNDKLRRKIDVPLIRNEIHGQKKCVT